MGRGGDVRQARPLRSTAIFPRLPHQRSHHITCKAALPAGAHLSGLRAVRPSTASVADFCRRLRGDAPYAQEDH
eukprot:scaffold125183_cov27-Tisochrysis_lutea.AAC.4